MGGMTQGVALDYNIARRWRFFSSDNYADKAGHGLM